LTKCDVLTTIRWWYFPSGFFFAMDLVHLYFLKKTKKSVRFQLGVGGVSLDDSAINFVSKTWRRKTLFKKHPPKKIYI